jgi:uncharacterized membrane protein YvlD (DUF360 family)
LKEANMDNLLTFFMVYALLGFIISLAENMLSIFGMPIGGNETLGALQFGIFPMWFFLVAVVFKRMFRGGMGRNEFWKAAFSGCPEWMKYLKKVIYFYAAINFLIMFIVTITSPHGKPAGGAPPAAVWRGVSAFWMVFYYTGLASLISARRLGWSKLDKRCPNGHDVSWSDAYCPTCGSRIGD